MLKQGFKVIGLALALVNAKGDAKKVQKVLAGALNKVDKHKWESATHKTFATAMTKVVVGLYGVQVNDPACEYPTTKESELAGDARAFGITTYDKTNPTARNELRDIGAELVKIGVLSGQLIPKRFVGQLYGPEGHFTALNRQANTPAATMLREILNTK